MSLNTKRTRTHLIHSGPLLGPKPVIVSNPSIRLWDSGLSYFGSRLTPTIYLTVLRFGFIYCSHKILRFEPLSVLFFVITFICRYFSGVCCLFSIRLHYKFSSLHILKTPKVEFQIRSKPFYLTLLVPRTLWS